MKPHHLRRLVATLTVLAFFTSCSKDEPKTTSSSSPEPITAEVNRADISLLTPSGNEASAENSVDVTPAAAGTSSGLDRSKIMWTSPKMVHDEIKYHNPIYNGQGQFELVEGKLLTAVVAGTGMTSVECFRDLGLRAIDISNNPIRDLSPLAGMKLQTLYADGTLVEDLTPLRGMPLTSFYAGGTPLHTLTGLEGAPLAEFNIVGTRVADLTPLEGAPLKMVWLTGCPITDVSPLAKSPLVSITLHQTKITDLSPFTGTRLQRLHIAETPVTDLRPLANVPLTRLVFTPPLITAGIPEIRAIPTLREIGTRFDDAAKDLVSPAQFWPAFDAAMSRRPIPGPVRE